MNRFYGMALLAAVAAAPVALEAQTPRTGQGQEQRIAIRGQQAPFARILEHRAELGLSADQVRRIEAVQQRLQAQNAPLIEQLRASGALQRKEGEARARSGERSRLTPAQREQLRQRAQNMTPEQREQMRQRMQNMTPEQREALRQQMRERRQSGELGQRGPGVRAERQIPEELRPVVQQIQTNRRAAMQEVQTVLTAEQQTRLRELVRQHMRGAGERQGQARGIRGFRGAR